MNETEIDPILTNDDSNISTKDPLLPKGDIEVQIEKVEQRRNKANTGNYLNFEVSTVEPHKAVDGKSIIPAGRRIFGMINLTPSDHVSSDDIVRTLKRAKKAFGLTENWVPPWDKFKGVRGKIRVGISKPTEDFPDEKNQIVWVA